jgi:hypothetical protein
MADTRSNTIHTTTPNTSMADTRSINTIRITTPNASIRIITPNTSTLRTVTLRIKATADRSPILERATIVGAAASHAENTS